MNTLEAGFNFKNVKGEIIYPKQVFFNTLNVLKLIYS